MKNTFYIYREWAVTASQPIVTSSHRRLGFRDGLADAVTPPWNLLVMAFFWRRHQFSLLKLFQTFWVQAVTLNFSLHDAVTPCLTPSLRKVLVNFRVSWVFFIFRTFPLQKRPKVLLLQFPLQKHLKWEKKRLLVKSNHKMHNLRLKPTP